MLQGNKSIACGPQPQLGEKDPIIISFHPPKHMKNPNNPNTNKQRITKGEKAANDNPDPSKQNKITVIIILVLFVHSFPVAFICLSLQNISRDDIE